MVDTFYMRRVPGVISESAPSAVDRRTAIADAAITLLATEGSRRLTHRAIDRALGFPEGSTSAYLRTRASLFVAATNRLAELDRASIADLAGRLVDTAEDASPGRLIAAIVDDWTTPQAAPRQLARIELQLESLRTPELAEVLAAQRSAFIGVTRALVQSFELTPAAVADPDALAGVITALVDGLIADRLLHQRTAAPGSGLADSLDVLLLP